MKQGIAICLAAMAILPFPAAARTVHVAGWAVSERPEQDGGHLVELEKSRKGWMIEHHAALWRGNLGPFEGAVFKWKGCNSGEADYQFPWDHPLTLEALESRFGDYFDECKVPEAARARILSGLPKAWVVFDRWKRSHRGDTD